jgi:hypothetical protein
MRHAHPKPLAAAAAPMAACHIDCSPGLVDERRSPGIEVELMLEPSFAPNQKSERSCSAACAVFFARDGVSSEEALDRAEAEGQPLLRQARANSFNRVVPPRAERRRSGVIVRLDPIRALVPPRRRGEDRPGPAPVCASG